MLQMLFTYLLTCCDMLLLLQVVFLRNYGVLVMGESIEEAFLTAANVVAAVDTQVTY